MTTSFEVNAVSEMLGSLRILDDEPSPETQ
jgi:hypothetical protein